jgi:hypothetical protein
VPQRRKLLTAKDAKKNRQEREDDFLCELGGLSSRSLRLKALNPEPGDGF